MSVPQHLLDIYPLLSSKLVLSPLSDLSLNATSSAPPAHPPPRPYHLKYLPLEKSMLFPQNNYNNFQLFICLFIFYLLDQAVSS